MNVATLAGLERLHRDGEILNPMLGIGTSPPGNIDILGDGPIADVGSRQGYVIVNVRDIHQTRVFLAQLTVPALDALLGAVGQDGIGNNRPGEGHIVSVGYSIELLSGGGFSIKQKDGGDRKGEHKQSDFLG